MNHKEGPVNLGIDGVKLPDQKSAEADKLTGAQAHTGPVNLQLDSANFEERFIVMVRGQPVSTVLSTRSLAEQFIMQLPPEQRNEAQIVPSTPDGRQILLG